MTGHIITSVIDKITPPANMSMTKSLEPVTVLHGKIDSIDVIKVIDLKTEIILVDPMQSQVLRSRELSLAGKRR